MTVNVQAVPQYTVTKKNVTAHSNGLNGANSNTNARAAATPVLLLGAPAVRGVAVALLTSLGYTISAEVDCVADALKELRWRTVGVVVIAERRQPAAKAAEARIRAANGDVRVAVMSDVKLVPASTPTVEKFSEVDSDQLESLTPREHEIHTLLKSRRTNHEIARTLHISHWTVKSHVNHILKKLGLSSRREIGSPNESSPR